MNQGVIVEEIIFRPVDGMQLCDGVIRMESSQRFVGCLPFMSSVIADTVDEVLRLLEKEAKSFFGDDVEVETMHHFYAV